MASRPTPRGIGAALGLALALVALGGPTALAHWPVTDQAETVPETSTAAPEPTGVLMLYVQPEVRLGRDGGPLRAGEDSDEVAFALGYRNTLAEERAWSATVTARPFTLDGDASQSLCHSHLSIGPGSTGDPDFAAVDFRGRQSFPHDDSPVPLMDAGGTVKGEFHTGTHGGDSARLQLRVPERTDQGAPIGDGRWRTTLTYTLTG